MGQSTHLRLQKFPPRGTWGLQLRPSSRYSGRTRRSRPTNVLQFFMELHNGYLSQPPKKNPKKKRGNPIEAWKNSLVDTWKCSLNWTLTTLTNDHQQDLLDTFLVTQLQVVFLPITRPHVVEGVKSHHQTVSLFAIRVCCSISMSSWIGNHTFQNWCITKIYLPF